MRPPARCRRYRPADERVLGSSRRTAGLNGVRAPAAEAQRGSAAERYLPRARRDPNPSQHLPGKHLLVGLLENLAQFAICRRRNFDGDLVGLELEQGSSLWMESPAALHHRNTVALVPSSFKGAMTSSMRLYS